ncbi:hypothetical protein [Muricoccus radiodurans]|uniref:hypothetical protein n=1 Tax=Muricoccus radiodurans TaxID=2231721 RepID=UPI003CEC0566
MSTERSNPISPEISWAVARYMQRSNHFRELFTEGLNYLNTKYGADYLSILTIAMLNSSSQPPSGDLANDIRIFQRTEIFKEYYVASLFVLLEGYNKKNLFGADKDIDRIQSNPLTPRLKAFRHGLFHFELDQAKWTRDNVLNEPEVAQWTYDLSEAFHAYFDRIWRESAAASGIPDPASFSPPP